MITATLVTYHITRTHIRVGSLKQDVEKFSSIYRKTCLGRQFEKYFDLFKCYLAGRNILPQFWKCWPYDGIFYPTWNSLNPGIEYSAHPPDRIFRRGDTIFQEYFAPRWNTLSGLEYFIPESTVVDTSPVG